MVYICPTTKRKVIDPVIEDGWFHCYECNYRSTAPSKHFISISYRDKTWHSQETEQQKEAGA